MKIVGERIIIRYPKVEDTKFYYQNYIKDKDVNTYLEHAWISKIKSIKDMQKELRRRRNGYKKKEYNFTILNKETNELMGGALLHINEYHQRGEIGLWLAKKYWGKGYGSKAFKLLIDCGFNNFNLVKITSGACFDNKASLALQKKFGFKNEGIGRKHFRLASGRMIDTIRMGILREEWKKCQF